jgi:tetratricopeptide (TPR) repeat protein
LFREINSVLNIASCNSNIGIIYRLKGDFAEAEKYYNEALKIYREKGHVLGQAKILYNFGNIESEQSRFDNALSYFNEALIFYEKSGSLKYMAETLSSLAMTHIKLGKRETALAQLEQAYKIYLDLKIEDETFRSIKKWLAYEYHNLGSILLSKATDKDPKLPNGFPKGWLDVLVDRDKVLEAEILLKKAVELDPNNAGMNFSLGHVLRFLEKHEDAKIAYQKAIELDPKFNLGPYAPSAYYPELRNY